jgi:hypothetical protein
MQKHSWYLLSVMILLVSCQTSSNEKGTIEKVWLFSEVNFKEKESGQKKAKPEPYHLILSPESFIDLQKDGTYTSFLGRMDKGKWKVKDDKLILYNALHDIVFDIVSAKNGLLKLYYPARNAEYIFEGFTNNFTRPEDNPFSLVNNQWRFKAKHKESDEEIDARLKNHLLFHQKYFDWGAKEHEEGLYVNRTASPVDIYSNGFQLKQDGQLPYEWANLFYDKIDCRKAYERLYYVVALNKVDWPKSDNDFKKLASAFKQVQQQFANTPRKPLNIDTTELIEKKPFDIPIDYR